MGFRVGLSVVGLSVGPEVGARVGLAVVGFLEGMLVVGLLVGLYEGEAVGQTGVGFQLFEGFTLLCQLFEGFTLLCWHRSIWMQLAMHWAMSLEKAAGFMKYLSFAVFRMDMCFEVGPISRSR